MWNIVTVLGVVVMVLTGIPVLAQLRRHPRGLIILFFAEMWERFSYYGMRGLLIFYLTEHFLFSDTFSQGQYGAYTTLVYLLPLLGGYLADRFLGSRKAIAFGAVLLVVGQLGMAIEGKPAVQTVHYGGHAYAFQVEGRMDDRKVCLKVGDGCYQVGPAPAGGLQIVGLPATAPLPAVLAKGAYTQSEQRDPLFVEMMYLALGFITVSYTHL